MLLVVTISIFLLKPLIAMETCNLSSFMSKDGDYILGGLFQLHGMDAVPGVTYRQPQALECHRFRFLSGSYQQIQVMRFAVEEINNATDLLPGVRLGYEIFDYCSDSRSFQAAMDFLSWRGAVPVSGRTVYRPKVISVTGPFGSTKTISVSPLFMAELIPMVTHGASSVQLSNKLIFPSFFRTIPSDTYQVKAIVDILKEFMWDWVAFIGDDNDYSNDALAVFKEEIRSANICLAYQDRIPKDRSKIDAIFDKLNDLEIGVVVVFANHEFVIPFIRKAIEKKVQKIWIASETWSSNRELIKENQVGTIGTVLGITIQGQNPLYGFEEFIHNTKDVCSNMSQLDSGEACNQFCSACSTISAKTVIEQDPTYSFSIYSAVYAVAHAIHMVLLCGQKTCKKSTIAKPYMVTEALKQVKFKLYNQSIEFDDRGDPSAHYHILYWDYKTNPSAVTIGSYTRDPTPSFKIDHDRIHWHGSTEAPVLRCSLECKVGYRKVQTGFHTCCFECEICTNGTYINHTADPHNCIQCQTDEWSNNGSTLCKKRSIEFLRYTDPLSMSLMFVASFVLFLSSSIFALFMRNYDTPVVKSAGGKLCFFMLCCLSLSSISVFFFIGQPSQTICKLRKTLFLIFYVAILSCLTVRSFQIVCVFKMAAKLPRAYDLWVKYGGQWLIILTFIIIQLFLCTLWICIEGPKPIEITLQKEIVLECTSGNWYIFYTIMIFVALLSIACFAFAYMGTDLPSNYNEGKAITLSLLIFYISWIVYITVDLSVKGKYITAVNAVSILSSIYGILVGYFLPKCYIIIFKPEHNTPSYFQSSIQSYTLQGR